MRVFARVELQDGRVFDLAPGAIIGRMPQATLRLRDPRISEAHALVSLRRTELKLLALRGRFQVDGVSVAEAALKPGARIDFGGDIVLHVRAVSLPDCVYAIRGDALPLQVLPPVAAILELREDLVVGFMPEADALLWSDGDGLHLRIAGERDRDVQGGDAFTVGRRAFFIEEVLLEDAGSSVTQRQPDRGPLTLTLRYDSVHIGVGDDTVLVDGVPARILSELALMRVPVEWRTVAQEVWPEVSDEVALRRNWDAGVGRLRKRLMDGQVRTDLVRIVGRGRVEIFLRPHDRVEDET